MQPSTHCVFRQVMELYHGGWARGGLVGRLCQGQERIEDGQCWGGVGRPQDEEALLMKESTQPPAPTVARKAQPREPLTT